MRYAQASFSNLPLFLALIPEGRGVAVVAAGPFAPFYDLDGPAFFHADGFQIADRQYKYGTVYRCEEETKLVEWLERQKLILGAVVTTM